MKRGIILFGHGARNPDWAAPFERIRQAILAREAETAVEFAFLEYLSPDLATSVQLLADQGARDVVVIPVFISSGLHVRENLPQLLAEARWQHPQIRFALAEPLGEAAAMIEAIAAYALSAFTP